MSKRKTIKRKISKRKTNRKTASKRKTNKRKTNKKIVGGVMPENTQEEVKTDKSLTRSIVNVVKTAEKGNSGEAVEAVSALAQHPETQKAAAAAASGLYAAAAKASDAATNIASSKRGQQFMNTAINKFESELKGQNLTNNAQQNRRQNNTRSQSMPRLGSEIYQQQNEGTENPITISCSCNPA